MMRRLDQRGVAAFEFCVVAVAFFTLVFAIFDLGRYAITMQSLRALAGAGARAAMLDDCYTNAVLQRSTPTCSGDYLIEEKKKAIAPFLYSNGSAAPTLSTSTGATALTVTASQNLHMLMPILWGTALNDPSASTSVPF
jgi:Flp pilus assembly protein TadG